MAYSKNKRRNAAGGPAVARPSNPPRRRSVRRAPPPSFSTTIASVAGGGGGALLGGLLASQDIMSPEAVGLAMAAGGAIGAYTMDGNMRIAANGVAAAGAGQLALALMAKRDAAKVAADATKSAATAKPAPPPNGAPARQGYGPARVFNRFQHTAAHVRDQLAFADDDDGSGEAFADDLD